MLHFAWPYFWIKNNDRRSGEKNNSHFIGAVTDTPVFNIHHHGGRHIGSQDKCMSETSDKNLTRLKKQKPICPHKTTSAEK